MKRNKIILIGAGGHAQSCIDVIEVTGIYAVHGMVGTIKEKGEFRYGYKIIGNDEDLTWVAKLVPNALIAVGQIKDSNRREYLYKLALNIGFKLPTIISRYAYVSNSSIIGQGTIVMHGAIVNASSMIDENCIINNRALIEHGVHICKNTHISTGVIINGDATIGKGTFIGSGAVIKEGVVVGENCIIPMGAKVKCDVPDNIHYKDS